MANSKKSRGHLIRDQNEVCGNKYKVAPSSSKYYDSNEKQICKCICCGSSLFSSDLGFDVYKVWSNFLEATIDGRAQMELSNSYGKHRIKLPYNPFNRRLGPIIDSSETGWSSIPNQLTSQEGRRDDYNQ